LKAAVSELNKRYILNFTTILFYSVLSNYNLKGFNNYPYIKFILIFDAISTLRRRTIKFLYAKKTREIGAKTWTVVVFGAECVEQIPDSQDPE